MVGLKLWQGVRLREGVGVALYRLEEGLGEPGVEGKFDEVSLGHIFDSVSNLIIVLSSD